MNQTVKYAAARASRYGGRTFTYAFNRKTTSPFLSKWATKRAGARIL